MPILTFIFGTIIGSFLNVVIYRLPKKIPFIRGTSYCPHCKTHIKPIDLIPIISYVFLKGKCRHCQQPISIRYPIIEALTGLLMMLVYLRYGLSLMSIIGLVLTALLIVITMIDIDTMEIYDRFHVMIIVLGVITMLISDLPILDHVIGFFIISVPFLIIAMITNGIGGGDIKLIAAAGLLLGYQSTLVAFIIASILGGFVAIMLVIFKLQHRKSLIAFGPYLCLGIYVAFLVGKPIFDWYISLLS